MRALSPILQTLFAEIVQQITSASRGGTVYTREWEVISYYYAKVPVGVDRIDTVIGKFGDATAEQEVQSLRRGTELAQARRKLVSLLR